MLNEEMKRLSRLDVLRVTSVFAVVFTHVSSGVLRESVPLTSVNWWVSNLAISCARWCIPVFVMISGALLLDPSRNEELMFFYKKRMQRVAIPLVFWSFFYIAVRYSKGNFTVEQAISSIAKGEPAYHLWYIYMVLGLYLLTPFLRTYVKYATSRERFWLIIVIFILTNCYHLVNSLMFRNQQSVFTLFVPYIPYYLCGYELRVLDSRRIEFKYLCGVIIVCGLSIAIGTGFLIKLFGMQGFSFFYSYLQPLTIVMSIAVFLVVYHGRYPNILEHRFVAKIVEQLAPATFGIYLLHVIVLEVIKGIVGQARTINYAFVMIPAITIVTFFVCYMIVSVLASVRILQPIVAFDQKRHRSQPTNSLYHTENLARSKPAVIGSTLEEKIG